ncbi:hypothetical protein B0T19DRAFT_473783 [Cercophora scortea]|uniref:C2H2-type domain-containing protein n=1 Tax=Cercophora scortea TaxID=314031 RepID=A0AAE0IY19_9PEZI|nr:hypothetical protein B0T19DRAFT_473783 [Cercophora scortea]
MNDCLGPGPSGPKPARKRRLDDTLDNDASESDRDEGPEKRYRREDSQQHGLMRPYSSSDENHDPVDTTSSSGEASLLMDSISNSSGTHDTSSASFHYPNLNCLTKDLQQAIDASWKGRQEATRFSKYQAVKAFLVSWEDDDLGVEKELDELAQLFDDVYSYDVEKWKIPSSDQQERLDEKVRDVIKGWQSPSSLLIFYYAGHARPSRHPGTYPVWVSRRDNPKEVYPLSVHLYLENASCDILFLYDCCHSIHTGSGQPTSGVKEALAAGGFETIAAEVGEHSFTYLLTHELARAAAEERSISVSDLHGHMLAGLGEYKPRPLKDLQGKILVDHNRRPRFELPRRRTPVHYFLSLKHETIILAPVRPSEPAQQIVRPPPLGSRMDAIGSEPNPNPSSALGREDFITITAKKFPQVLVAVRIDSSVSLDISTWLEWALKAPPEALDIKVEGWFGSFSTLLILNLPLRVWHLMPAHPAASFIGFVTTDNEASTIRKDWPLRQVHVGNLKGEKLERESQSLSAGDSNQKGTESPEPLISTNNQQAGAGDLWHGGHHDVQQHGGGSSYAKTRAPSEISTSSSLFAPNSARKRVAGNPDNQRLSCPFRKRNPLRFNTRAHQSCALRSFSDISQVKRHVKAFHNKPANSPFSCPACLRDFKTKEEYKDHLELPPSLLCIPAAIEEIHFGEDPEDGITARIADLLSERLAINKIQDWDRLWTTLFPMDQTIPDGEFVPPIEIDEFMAKLHRNWPQFEHNLERAVDAILPTSGVTKPDLKRSLGDLVLEYLQFTSQELQMEAKEEAPVSRPRRNPARTPSRT